MYQVPRDDEMYVRNPGVQIKDDHSGITNRENRFGPFSRGKITGIEVVVLNANIAAKRRVASLEVHSRTM